jgi:uncharacterized membrane protein
MKPVKQGTASLLLFIAIALALAETSWLSLRQFLSHSTRAFDLGHMAQAIWSATQGRPLVFTAVGVPWSRLSLHVELIYLAFAPLYAVVPTPATLLFLQAGLYALGAVPVYRLAKRRLGSGPAAAGLAATYLLFPAGQNAVLFEFHADTLAMPLLLFAIEALDRRALRQYAVWTALALSCKFYVAAVVAALGVTLWLTGRRRTGALTFAAGAAWGAIAFFVIRPIFSPPETAAAEQTAVTLGGYIHYYFGALTALDNLPMRAASAAVVLIPGAAILGRWAPAWLIPALAIILPVAASTGPGPSYHYRFHHYALAVPFLLAATIYGAARLKHKQAQEDAQSRGRVIPWPRLVLLSFLVTLLFNVAFVDGPLNPLFHTAPDGQGMGYFSQYRISPRDQLRRAWLAESVPGDAAAAADRLSGLHLVNRKSLYISHMLRVGTPHDVLQEVDFVVTDALFDYVIGVEGEISEGGVATDWDMIRAALASPDFVVSDMRDGLILFSRQGPGLSQSVEVLADGPVSLSDAQEAMEGLYLVAASASPLPGGRYRLQFDRVRTQPQLPPGKLFAVSRLEGAADGRLVHLPSAFMLPPNRWPVGLIVRESFEVTLPDGLPEGEYRLLTAWYDAGHVRAADTGPDSRVGQELAVTTLTLP